MSTQFEEINAIKIILLLGKRNLDILDPVCNPRCIRDFVFERSDLLYGPLETKYVGVHLISLHVVIISITLSEYSETSYKRWYDMIYNNWPT